MVTGSAWRPRQRRGVLLEDFGDAAVLYDPRTDQFHRLNEAGRLLWMACDGDRTVAEIATYADSRGLTNEGSKAFLDTLADLSLLE